jgi:hypothetical protein
MKTRLTQADLSVYVRSIEDLWIRELSTRLGFYKLQTTTTIRIISENLILIFFTIRLLLLLLQGSDGDKAYTTRTGRCYLVLHDHGRSKWRLWDDESKKGERNHCRGDFRLFDVSCALDGHFERTFVVHFSQYLLARRGLPPVQ